jgi:DNA ligase D-like protein (predicted 3'-phosphoesterase)
MPRKDPLKTYREMREFGQTPEPKGRTSKSHRVPIFVVQEHRARRLHYDFRLEVGGALKSWAVPKGPSMNPRDKRLAVPTEDHPREYANFSGDIPEGHYGAGRVDIWDKGTYENLREEEPEPVSMERAIEEGHVKIRMHGDRLKGKFALTRMKKDDEDAWLLVKMKDEEAES